MFFILLFVSLVSIGMNRQSALAEEISCIGCHSDVIASAKSKHAAIALGCQSCHVSVAGKNHPTQKGSIELTQPMPGLCYSCHNEAGFKAKKVHTPIATGMCTGCHDAHTSNSKKLLIQDMPGLCYNCHDQSKFKGAKVHEPVGGGLCTGCHNPHSSDYNKILNEKSPDVCFSCHDKAMFSKKYVHGVIAMGCEACHLPHVGNNPSLLVNKVQPLCLSCHVKKSDGRHVTTATGNSKRVHPVGGVVDPSTTSLVKVPDPKVPGRTTQMRDPNNPGEEMTCVSCHEPHSSDFKKLFVTKNICGKCHKYF